MALFSKEKRISDRERLLGQELKRNRYETLGEAIVNEVSLGSQDSKVTRITLPEDRVITILTASGKVILARDSERPVSLADFLYWTDLDKRAKTRILKITEDHHLDESVLTAIAAGEPDSLSVIHKAVLDATHEALLCAHRNFADYLTIETEIFRNVELVNQLLEEGLDILEIAASVEANELRELELYKILAIANVLPHDVQLLKTPKEKTETYLLEKRFVMAAAEAETTLDYSYEMAAGLRWVNVLQRLRELVEDDQVELKVTVLSEALPSEIFIKKPHEVIFHLTLDVEDSLDHLVESVFSFSGDIDLAKSLSEKNTILEERIFEIEDWIIRELATEEYESFEDLPEDFQISLRGLILERREINEKRQSFLERLRGLIIVDTQSTEDDLLREKIDLKLHGIELAVDHLPASHENVLDSGFQLTEDKPEFNFNDGRIVRDTEGESLVEHLEDAPEAEFEEEESVDLEEMLKIALEENPLQEPEPTKPVDLDLLEEHIAKLSRRRRKA